jgi:hypothetical protein
MWRVRVMLFNATFSYIVAVIFIGDKKPEYPAKTTKPTIIYVANKGYAKIIDGCLF